MKDHIQNILAEFEEKFVDKYEISDRLDDLSKSQLKSFFSTALSEAYEAGLRDAEGCVPEARLKEAKLATEEGGIFEADEKARIGAIAGFNSCRTMTLEAIKKLRE